MPDQVTIPFNPGDSNPFEPGTTPPGFPSTPPWLPPPVGPDTNYAPQQPGDYPDTTPSPTNPPPVVEPTGPPSPPEPGPPVYTDTGGWGSFPVVGAIWGRRVYKPGLAEKAIARGIKTGIEAVFRSVAARFPRQLPSEPPTPNLPILRPPGPPPPPPPGGLAYYAAEAGEALVAAITSPLAIATGIVAGLIPRSTASNDTTAVGYNPSLWRYFDQWGEDIAQKERDARDAAFSLELARDYQARGIDLQIGEGNTVIRPPRPQVTRGGLASRIFRSVEEWEREFSEAFPGEVIPIRIGRSLPGMDQPFSIPEPGVMRSLPSSPVFQTPSSTTPTENTTVPSSPRSQNVTLPRPKVRWGRIGIGLGSLVGANLLLPRLLGGDPYGSGSYNAPGATIVTPPGTSIPPVVAVSPALVVGGFGGAGGVSPYCTPAPRGPRRKCLERAPVAWRSGSRKGKSAGTKCLRYASRAS